MRKVKICDIYPRSYDSDRHTKLIVCPLTGNACTPDCAAYETGPLNRMIKELFL